MTDYQKIYEDMINNLNKKNSEDISNVVKAFNYAKELHKDQFRKSGEPYILHPVEVAKILEGLNFNTDVICAALLHDTVEDCGITVEELSKKFNKNIAQIVDAVTAIQNENFKPDADDIYANTDDFLKLAMEDKTYQKLIAIGKLNKFGFYIKFADRLNNLQTIAPFARYKKEAKIQETRKWIIPLAKLLKSKFFYDNLKNMCFCIENEEEKYYFDSYTRFVNTTKKPMYDLKNEIELETNNYLKSLKQNNTLFDVIVEPKTQLEIFNSISKFFDINKLSSVKPSNFISVPTYNIYIVLNDNLKNTKNIEFLYNMITNTNLSDFIQVVGANSDTLDNFSLVTKDKIRNLINISLMSKKEYTEMQNGTISGTDIDYVDETIAGGVETNFITVFTHTNEKIKIPAKSTVLDFAFRVHKDIGFSCKYAYINNSPQRAPIYTRLNSGDKIEIVCELDENNMNKNIAELRWLAYCKTEYTQRILIKYFEKKYN